MRPKPCECERPIPIQEDDLDGNVEVRCVKCGRELAP